jgi:methyltransferase family protein
MNSAKIQDKSRGRVARAIRRARELGFAQLFALIRQQGAKQSLRFVAGNLRHIIADRIARGWDRQYNVDTAGSIQLSSLTIDSPNKHFGNECLCISPRTFDFMLRNLPSDLSSYTFVDIGAGKSRSLLVASRYGFAKIVGVEFAKELVEYSRRNISQFRAKWQRCHDLQILEADATDYSFPETPLVLFFYNPFMREVFIEVLNNILTSLHGNKRDCFIVYCSSSHNAVDWVKPLILDSDQFVEVKTQSMPIFFDAVRTVRFAIFQASWAVGQTREES